MPDHTKAPGSLDGEQPIWHRMSEAAGLVTATGEVQETVFGRMTQLAAQHDAVNLGQGAPGDPAPTFLLDAAYAAMREGTNQYAPPLAHPSCAKRSRCIGSATGATASPPPTSS